MPTFDEYSDGLFGNRRDPLLDQFLEEARRAGLPEIQIPDEVGRLLQVLITTTGARQILELGLLFGYSSMWMGRALPDDGRIVSLEAEPKHAAVARRNLERAGLLERVEIVEGEALKTLPSLESRRFDLVFIDADKGNYPGYLDWAVRLSHPGTLIVTDNVWSRIADGGQDLLTPFVEEFNQHMAENPRLVSTIIPTRGGQDGLAVAAVR
ncbi:MAG: O-methyltransferase [Chloroflexota bacterium]